MKYILALWHLFISSVVGFFAASVLHTQAVLSKLTEIDIVVSFSERLQTSITDLIGLAPVYGSTVFVTLLLSFTIAGLVNLKLKLSRYVIYPLAAALGFYIMLVAMYSLLNATIIAGARGVTGQLLQMSAGVIAAVLFAYLREKTQKRPA